MTTYRKIHGRSIKSVSTTDPSESVAEGQIWFNTTVINLNLFGY